MPQVANNRKSTTPESDAHSIHVHIVREGVYTYLQRNLEKDSQSWITRGWNLRILPTLTSEPYRVRAHIALFTVQREMVALDQGHI